MTTLARLGATPGAGGGSGGRAGDVRGWSRRRWLAGALSGLGAHWSGPAHGAPQLVARDLSRAERSRLLQGGQVRRSLSFYQGDAKYVGGLSYQRCRRPPAEVVTRLQDVAAVRAVLPKVREARRLAAPPGQHRFALVQGTSLYSAGYAVVAQRPAPAATELRFWLDPQHPHEIDDVWGFFRAQAFGSGSLISVGVALDLGDGIIRWLFEDRIVEVMLDMPRRIRDFVD